MAVPLIILATRHTGAGISQSGLEHFLIPQQLRCSRWGPRRGARWWAFVAADHRGEPVPWRYLSGLAGVWSQGRQTGRFSRGGFRGSKSCSPDAGTWMTCCAGCWITWSTAGLPASSREMTGESSTAGSTGSADSPWAVVGWRAFLQSGMLQYNLMVMIAAVGFLSWFLSAASLGTV